MADRRLGDVSSSAACVKLAWRAAASKARRAFNGSCDGSSRHRLHSFFYASPEHSSFEDKLTIAK